MVRVWDLFWNRLSDEDFAPNTPANLYRGMLANDDDLILVNDTSNALEYYDLTDYSYDNSKDVALGTGTWSAATRGGDNLFIGNNAGDIVSIRSLTGTETSTFTASSSLPLHSPYSLQATEYSYFTGQQANILSLRLQRNSTNSR